MKYKKQKQKGMYFLVPQIYKNKLEKICNYYYRTKTTFLKSMIDREFNRIDPQKTKGTIINNEFM